MKASNKRLIVPVTEEQHKELKILCAEREISISDYLRQLIAKDTNSLKFAESRGSL